MFGENLAVATVNLNICRAMFQRFFCPAVFSSLRTASLAQQDGIIDFDYVGKAPFSARKS